MQQSLSSLCLHVDHFPNSPLGGMLAIPHKTPMNFSVFLQYVLPHHLLSKFAYFLAGITYPPFKNHVIQKFIREVNVDMAEAIEKDPLKYKSFNDFFTRKISFDKRPIQLGDNSISAPADGKVSQAGVLLDGDEVQAKTHAFSVEKLLANPQRAQAYKGGSFLNIYLSPKDYHRLHMPVDGELVETVYVPGRLYSVAPWAVRAIPGLFARNERLVCHFETAHGPMCLVFVGAMLVSGIETVWGGVEIPAGASGIVTKDYRGKGISFKRLAEIGRFNYGSTIICFWPKGAAALHDLKVESATWIGQDVGSLN